MLPRLSLMTLPGRFEVVARRNLYLYLSNRAAVNKRVDTAKMMVEFTQITGGLRNEYRTCKQHNDHIEMHSEDQDSHDAGSLSARREDFGQ